MFWKFRRHQGYYSNIAYWRNRQGCNCSAGVRCSAAGGSGTRRQRWLVFH